MILLNNPMKVVMVILFGLSIIEVLISIRLYKMILNIDKIEKKKRKIYVEEVQTIKFKNDRISKII